MTNEIRIDDLRAPVLNDIQKMGRDYGETVHTELSVDAVCAAAMAQTELDDFGPEDFRERLEVQLEEMNADPERTGLGRMLMFGDCVRYASNRLRIHDLLKQHPEILELPIEKPVIVIGLPRSGTTNLVNLLASDSRFRSMPLWESYQPVPDPREATPSDGVDPRWTRCQGMWESMQVGAPFVAAMHPMEPDHVHEEIELMTPDFSSYNLEWVARAPKWRDYYLSHDQTPHYEYAKTVLQIMQWYRPRERWVLKSPQHLEQIGPLMSTFPDASIVVTHRDPVAVVQSTITMVTYGARTAYKTPNQSGTATTGSSESGHCSMHRCVIVTFSPRAERLMCISTSTWPMNWALCSASMTPLVSSSPIRHAPRSPRIRHPILGGRKAGSSMTCALISRPNQHNCEPATPTT